MDYYYIQRSDWLKQFHHSAESLSKNDGMVLFLSQAFPSKQRALRLQTPDSKNTLRFSYQNSPIFWSFIEKGIWGFYVVRTFCPKFQEYQPIGFFHSQDCEAISCLSKSRQGEAWCKLYIERILQEKNHFLDEGEWHFIYTPQRKLQNTEFNSRSKEEIQHYQYSPWLESSDILDNIIPIKKADKTSGRFKFWQKQCKQEKMPPILLLTLGGLTYQSIILDGHLRFWAAIESGFYPPIIHLENRSLRRVMPDLDDGKQKNIIHQYEKIQSNSSLCQESALESVNMALIQAFDHRPYLMLGGGVATADLSLVEWVNEVKMYVRGKQFENTFVWAWEHNSFSNQQII